MDAQLDTPPVDPLEAPPGAGLPGEPLDGVPVADEQVLVVLDDELVGDLVAEVLEAYLAAERPATLRDDRLPRLAARVALTLTGVLLAWSAVLSATLPQTVVSQHWRLAWVGLDVVMALVAGTTGLLLVRGDRRAALGAVATSTLLVFDAWFDLCTAGTAVSRAVAIGESLLLELPLACGGVWLALWLLR